MPPHIYLYFNKLCPQLNIQILQKSFFPIFPLFICNIRLNFHLLMFQRSNKRGCYSLEHRWVFWETAQCTHTMPISSRGVKTLTLRHLPSPFISGAKRSPHPLLNTFQDKTEVLVSRQPPPEKVDDDCTVCRQWRGIQHLWSTVQISAGGVPQR